MTQVLIGVLGKMVVSLVGVGGDLSHLHKNLPRLIGGRNKNGCLQKLVTKSPLAASDGSVTNIGPDIECGGIGC